MSKLDIINDEIARREGAISNILSSEQAFKDAIEQFNSLDEFYRDQEQDSREVLECTYLENRHFTGEWPIVYSFALTEKYPYFGGSTDIECNPYFPITKVQDQTFDGLNPLFASPTLVGGQQRQRTFAATEDVTRVPALTQLQNFPDISNEPLPANFPDPQLIIPAHCINEDNPPQTSQSACESDNGTWIPATPVPDPVWNGPDTAPGLLRIPLQAWRDDMAAIQADLCETGTAEFDFWQSIIDDADIVLAAVATDAVFVRNTNNPDPATWGQTQPLTGADEIARANLEIAANTGIPAHVAIRKAKLDSDADTEEQIFFGLMKLRLHQANGSYSKLKATKGSQSTNQALKVENEAAIAALNLMKVKNS